MNPINTTFKKSTFVQWAFMVLLSGVLFACKNNVKEVAKLDSIELLPDQIVKEVEVMYSTEAAVVFQMNAPILHQYNGDKNYNEMPEGVAVKIFDKNNVVTTQMTSDYAIDSTYCSKMEARENVVVVNEKGERLNTEKLLWNKNTEKITTDAPVVITTEDQVIKGTGLISNQDFTEYEILNVTGIISIDE